MLINQAQHTSNHNSLIRKNIPLKDKNWFQTGGSARFFCEPTNAYEFQLALQFAQDNNLDIFVLGQGANILISDDGFDGLVIRPNLTEIYITTQNDTTVLVNAGAGTTMDALIEYCLDNNILGLEEFSGIPGTVGGSVYINLHYFEFLLDQFLISAQIINKKTYEIKDVDTTWFNFAYDDSKLHNHEYYLLNATFKLKKGTDIEIAQARGRRKEIIRHRRWRYPNTHTCGSFFRNFHKDEVTIEKNGRKAIWVAYYLDKIGVKGELQIGDAIVSYQHANMIVNQGNATSSDIIELTRQMQQLVKDKFGIIPQPECQLIGFKEYPLLR